MLQIKTLFFLLVGSNLLAVLVLLFQNNNLQSQKLTPTQLSTQEDSPSAIPEYTFDDPIFAYNILTQLDVYEPVGLEYLDDLMNQSLADGSTYKYGYLGFKIDADYCQRHRAYFADYPEAMFYDTNFILDYLNTSLVRRLVIPSVGVDLLPNVTGAMPQAKQKMALQNIPHNTNVFFINGAMHVFRQVGLNYACTSQSYNHIPGHSTLNRKDRVAESAVAYGKNYLDRPHCFNFNKFFPKTYSLYIEDQCTEFFKQFNSKEYEKLKDERRIVYIKKVGVGAHKAKGVDPVNEEEEKSLRELYANGTKCGQIDKNFIVQHFIHNPLLLEGHKFDFRIYMVIASTNPVILYYHDGFLRLSLHQYDVNSNDKAVLLTNTDLSLDTFKSAANGTLIDGMNETELRNFQMWNFTRLHNHLYEKGVVKDKNWLDNYLRPEFKKAMIHLIRMSQHSFLRRSPLFELFGVDFMLDSDLNLWFIECNTSPVLKGTSDEKEKFVSKMLRDQFEIVIGLLRSRMKRVLVYVNQLTEELKAQGATYDDMEIKDLEKRRGEFNPSKCLIFYKETKKGFLSLPENGNENFLQNFLKMKEIFPIKKWFEDEFKPSPENGFSKIIDENYSGVERFANLLDKDCL